MAFNTNSEDEGIVSEINMTPFIDIMLVLLIIFMVTSSVSLESGLDIDLPAGSSSGAQSDEKAIIVSLNREGELFLDGSQVDLDSFKNKLIALMSSKKTELVIFEGDKASSLGKTISVMELAKEAGAKSFGIATLEKN